MLVLRRKVGERIKIGHDIEIMVLRIQGGKTRLGVTAPRNLRVSRVDLPKAGDTAVPDHPAEQSNVHAGSLASSETNHMETTCESLH